MITFITGNEHKVKEAENIFKNYDIELEHIDLELLRKWPYQAQNMLVVNLKDL